MSIWVDPKGKAYAGEGENAWIKFYADYLSGKTKKELKEDAKAHYEGEAFRHRAEDVDYTEEETVAAALKREEDERTAAIFSLRNEVLKNTQNVVSQMEESLQEEAVARTRGDDELLAKMQQLPVQSGEGEGSMKSTLAAEASGKGAVAIGNNVRAKSNFQWARGMHNLPDEAETYLDIVGNGTATKPSNAYTLDKAGNAWFAGEIAIGKNKEKLATENYTNEAVAQCVGREKIVEQIDGGNLCLEENQDARLGETERLMLSMPEAMTDWYKSTFSFYSGEKATSLGYAHTPLLWRGDHVSSDGKFVPEPYSVYEVGVKNLGVNGVRARVDKVDGYASVSVEGTMLSLPDSAGKPLRGCKIYGNSVQDGEPSADNPVPIESVGNYNEKTGKYDIPIEVQGKNLIPYPYMYGERTVNGVTFTPKADGSIDVKGTATASATYVLYRNVNEVPNGIIPGKTYTFSINNAGKNDVENITGTINYYKTGTTSNSGYSGWLSASAAVSKTLAAPENIQGVYGYLNVASGKTVDGTVYPQLEVGEVASEHEPYLEPKITIVSLYEPLRKVVDSTGEHADCLDLAQDVVWRYVDVGDDTGVYPIEESYAVFQNGPVSEPIALPEVLTYTGDNTLSVNTSIQPSNMEITYFKKEG